MDPDRVAVRENQRARMDTYWAEQRERERAEHVATVEAVILPMLPSVMRRRAAVANDIAGAAVDALYADGVVFARMGKS